MTDHHVNVVLKVVLGWANDNPLVGGPFHRLLLRGTGVGAGKTSYVADTAWYSGKAPHGVGAFGNVLLASPVQKVIHAGGGTAAPAVLAAPAPR